MATVRILASALAKSVFNLADTTALALLKAHVASLESSHQVLAARDGLE